jgi:hypothetical protein
MTDYILEEMNKYDADGVDFTSLLSDGPLGPTVFESFAREEWLASDRRCPRMARRYWKMADGRKVYVDDYKDGE